MNADVVVAQIDDLYRRAVEDPSAVDDRSLADWADSAAESTGPDRDAAKALRRAVRTARKLARYWSQHDAAGLPTWRNGVDEALGGLGWRAQLDLLAAVLARHPDSMLFEQVKERHRAVHFSEWMEGVTYEEWLEEQG